MPDRRVFLQTTLAAALAGRQAAGQRSDRPNVVLIFLDDVGYADFGCFGAEGYATPRIDRMAAEGRRFTDFYVACPVCSASRASLLTGSYFWRLGLPGVLGPNSNVALHPDEVTLAELLRARGYATGCVGKWHLGDKPPVMPLAQGFDEYYGLPYSNDMWPWHYAHTPGPQRTANYPDLPFYRDNEVIELNPDQDSLTPRYTRYAVEFIERHRARPFFLYLPHSMGHIPLGVSPEWVKGTPYGRYGDMMQELDWSVGQVLDTLQRCGLDERTLVILTSDNGPWLPFGTHAGRSTPLREGKGTVFEGGVREPTIMRWPGQIPAGTVCAEPCATIDLLPTIARLCGTTEPTDRVIDGRDIRPLLLGEPGARSPHEAIFFSGGGKEPLALRAGRWKLILPHRTRHQAEPGGTDGLPRGQAQQDVPLSLFDLETDIAETTNLAEQRPDIVARLQALLAAHQEDLRRNSRAPARGWYVLNPVPLASGEIALTADRATIHDGRETKYVGEFGNIGSWRETTARVSWNWTPPRAGRWRVAVEQAAPAASAGATYELRLGDRKLIGTVQPTPGWRDYVTVELGVVELPATALEVTVQPLTKPGEAVMNLRWLKLSPVITAPRRSVGRGRRP